MQATLLRVLEEGEVIRVGENKPQKVDFGLVPATSRDLHTEVERDQFRNNLYYRVAAFPIRIRAQRARREDIADSTEDEAAMLRSRTAAFERSEIQAALARSGGNKSQAATERGITNPGLRNKMRRLGMLD